MKKDAITFLEMMLGADIDKFNKETELPSPTLDHARRVERLRMDIVAIERVLDMLNEKQIPLPILDGEHKRVSCGNEFLDSVLASGMPKDKLTVIVGQPRRESIIEYLMRLEKAHAELVESACRPKLDMGANGNLVEVRGEFVENGALSVSWETDKGYFGEFTAEYVENNIVVDSETLGVDVVFGVIAEWYRIGKPKK